MGRFDNNQSESGPCILCEKHMQLRISHVLPKFASDHIIRTSATGFIRSHENPNVPKQDGDKKRLLCEGCEAILSKYESWFSSQVFKPYMSSKIIDIEYGEYLKSFAASLAIRTLAAHDFKADSGRDLNRYILRAVRIWRRLLLEGVQGDQFEHHLIVFDYIKNTNIRTAGHLNMYLMRSISYDVLYQEKSEGVIVYSKLPGFLFLSAINPKKLRGFKGTKIFKKGTLKSRESNYVIGEGIMEYIIEKVEKMSLIKLSDGQAKKLAGRLEDLTSRNPKKLLASDTARASFYDERLRK